MTTRRQAMLGAAGAGLAAAMPRLAAAQGDVAAASPWSVGLGAKMRLVRGAPLADRDGFGAGIEIALDPGFKTYWRMPGDAGIPPVFDWSLSRNLAAIAPDWPAPRRFEEAGVSAIGYADGHVVLPLRVSASDADAPVELALSLVFAACKTICVPEKAEASLTLAHDGKDGLYAALIEMAARDIPERVEAAAIGLDQPQSARLSLSSGGCGLALRPALHEEEHLIDIFVEGPANWLFGAPRVTGQGAATDVELPLASKPKRVDRAADAPFTLTILTDLRAIETMIVVRPEA